MDTQLIIYLVPVAGLLALGYALLRARWVGQQDAGNERMAEIAAAISEGARAFLNWEYKVLGIFVAAVAALLVGANLANDQSSPLVAVSFVTGALCSALAGFIGMTVATKANVRTTQAARTGLASALGVAFSGGLVMGLSVVGLGVLGLSGLFIAYSNMGWDTVRVINVISGFSLGASSIALFARVGGGIYTKAADVGADLAGKVYEGIPEDDPRNPATIADNVGDNVGDVAGMGADLFESYVGSIIGTMVLGAAFIATFEGMAVEPLAGVLLPLVVAGVGIVVSIAGSFFVRVREGGNPQAALNAGRVRRVRHHGGAVLLHHPVDAAVGMDCRRHHLHVAGCLLCGAHRPGRRCHDRFGHRVLHVDRSCAGGRYFSAERDRIGHVHHCRPGCGHVLDGHSRLHSGVGHHRSVCHGWSLRHRDRGSRHAVGHRHSARGRCLWSDFGQRRRHRRNGATASRGPRADRQARRGRQHHRSDRQRVLP